MKILFICGSAEQGKDGVGDYTRRLCGKLIGLGHDAQILSLCDRHAPKFINENQEIEGNKIFVHRIPKEIDQNRRYNWTQCVLRKFQPDWISLQYVPHSFNPKGLPFWLPSFLKKINRGYYWHVMFHEIWLGIDVESPFKHKFIGKLQQWIAKRIIKNTSSNSINTQNKLYQFFLNEHNINAKILPIYSNIPLKTVEKDAKSHTQFVLFGSIHPQAPFECFIKDLLKIQSVFSKPIKFVFIGNNGVELSTYKEILKQHQIKYEVYGIQSEEIISNVLFNSDFGISTTPYFQTEKSGVFAAYKEHFLTTISVSRQWTPTRGQYIIPQIIKYEKNNLKLSYLNLQTNEVNNLAQLFINSISIS
ncbi:glycosyltransferase family protein [Flavobacterium agrisoli]|uniref:Glycosyltransferase involved in cell wall biosynthesis n=1 Tax=Flavobacterium agrisoli TaxID=2793066 RepID=A0A934PIN2_9FLAO|nr:hypothetical protein [Flavobacterium agrisoli]MBK0368801.1 hypothetical protein [Flavobacterium agrisoli]